jgi:hypothetical protein
LAGRKLPISIVADVAGVRDSGGELCDEFGLIQNQKRVRGIHRLPIAIAQAPPTPAFIALAELAQRRNEQSKLCTAIAFDPKQFDKYVGYFMLHPFWDLHIFRSEDQALS